MKEKKPLLEGQRFGRLTVICFHHKDKNRSRYYLCKCDCGNEVVVYKYNLIRGLTKSCGCLNSELATKRFRKHHLTGSRIYRCWIGMKNRCYNKNEPRYSDYGGRGIKVCDEWKNDFTAFYNWAIANDYKEDLTIDRIDVNGNYEPSNCRWATMKEQQRNRRNNRIIEYNGKSHCVAEWGEILGINDNLIRTRLFLGWDANDALKKRQSIWRI